MSLEKEPDRRGNIWEVESLRATFFLDADQTDEELRVKWWREVVGGEPDQTLSQRGIHRQTGRTEAALVSLTVQYRRVDWGLAAQISPSSEVLDNIPTIGGLADSTTLLIGILEKWIHTSPPIDRMAFGAVLFHSVPDVETGNERLRDYLPNIEIPDNSTDFLYQINRPVPSKTGTSQLMLNRLTKWSVNQVNSMRLTLGSQAQPTPVVSPFWVCRLELDMSTTGEFASTIPDDKRGLVFEELIELGADIAARGIDQ